MLITIEHLEGSYIYVVPLIYSAYSRKEEDNLHCLYAIAMIDVGNRVLGTLPHQTSANGSLFLYTRYSLVT